MRIMSFSLSLLLDSDSFNKTINRLLKVSEGIRVHTCHIDTQKKTRTPATLT